MELLSPAIVLLLLCVLMSGLYTYRLEKEQHQPKLLFGAAVIFFVAGMAMLFITAGWKWGLVGLGVSWLTVIVISLAITSAFRAKKYVDPLLIKRVNEVISVGERYKSELDDFWNSTSPSEAANLMVSFLEEVRRDWPRELLQLNPEELPASISVNLKNGIKQAYIVGYMKVKGWVSQEHLTDFILYLGDKLAHELTDFKGTKSNGNAFAAGYTAVSVRGTLSVTRRKD